MRRRPFATRVRAFKRLIFIFIAAFSVAQVCSAEARQRPARSCNLKESGDLSGKERLCQSVRRKHNRFRHRLWSGTLPFEGGFIPDPHCLCSEDGFFSEPVRGVISATDSQYAIVCCFHSLQSPRKKVSAAYGKMVTFEAGRLPGLLIWSMTTPKQKKGGLFGHPHRRQRLTC